MAALPNVQGRVMPKLTEREREGFEKILSKDLQAINDRFMNQIKDFWGIARKEILARKGWDKLMKEKEDLELEKKRIINRVHEIEGILSEEKLRVEQVVELGGKSNDYGKYSGANFYGIPVESQFDYEIVEYIRANIDLEIPSKILRDVCQSSIRALVMSGTFEEARAAYEKFYSLDFRRYGVDIPPRLDDICKDGKTMLYAQQSLQQIEKGKPDMKLIEGDIS
jgi:Rad3-related DNA helicase